MGSIMGDIFMKLLLGNLLFLLAFCSANVFAVTELEYGRAAAAIDTAATIKLQTQSQLSGLVKLPAAKSTPAPAAPITPACKPSGSNKC